jgi:hypothetical protein
MYLKDGTYLKKIWSKNPAAFGDFHHKVQMQLQFTEACS